ncbi:hypothetical protein, partial [Phocicoccus schoeneichii]|uniref:hypothetical protein n=1 Tax=Phocicoccus schoeneichii TaxID=1812261 RepID=UPI003D1010D3
CGVLLGAVYSILFVTMIYLEVNIFIILLCAAIAMFFILRILERKVKDEDKSFFKLSFIIVSGIIFVIFYLINF